MKRILILALAAAACLSAGSAGAATRVYSHNFGGGRWCDLKVEDVTWYQGYVRNNQFASCRIQYGNDWLPYTAHSIDLYGVLMKRAVFPPDIEADRDEAHAFPGSLVSVWLTYGCHASETLNTYYGFAAATFKMPMNGDGKFPTWSPTLQGDDFQIFNCG